MKSPRKRKSRTSLNFTSNLNTLSFASQTIYFIFVIKIYVR